MAGSLLIEPTAIYDDGAIALALDIRLATLARARREGKLRFTRKGQRVFYLGAWIIEWMQTDVKAPAERLQAPA